MPTWDVFISHASEDKDHVVLPLVAALENAGFTVWLDAPVLRPGNSLRQEIDEGLKHSRHGVVILSPTFFSKPWPQMELDALLARDTQERQILIPVWHQVDQATRVHYSPLLAGRLALSTADGIPRLAERLQDLLARPHLRPKPSGKHFDLTVQCTLNGGHLTRTYWYHYGRLTQYRSPWQWLETHEPGQAIFETLFGSQAQCYTVLQALFDAVLARPILHAVHVRIQTTAPQLANLPWSEATWDGNALRDYGWTFACLRGNPAEPVPEGPGILLKAPCPVFLLAPSNAPEVDVHYRALEERLAHAWPAYHEKPHWLRDWDSFVQVWPRRRPALLYYYGPLSYDADTVRLLFDGTNGQPDWHPLSDLQQVWQAHPPQIVLCNGVGQATPLGTAMAALDVPLVITQSSPEAHPARCAALAWLHELLEGGEDTDPVWALHQHGLPNAVAWQAYGTWRTRTVAEPSREELVGRLLDRKVQRALGQSALSELVRDVHRRLHCVLAYGATGNLVERFASQLHEHLRRHATDMAQVHRIPMRLPPPTSFDLPRLQQEVQRHWGLGPHESLGVALHKRQPQGPGRARPVLLLDWGVRGSSEATRLSLEALEAWLAFCCQHLAAQCPGEIRLIALLALEVAPDNHPLLEQRVRTLRAEERFRDRAFRIELLPRLDSIEVSDLADFLDGAAYSSCPDALIGCMPELISAQTGGHFADTVALVEEAERTGWYTLFDRLTAESGQTAPAPPAREILL